MLPMMVYGLGLTLKYLTHFLSYLSILKEPPRIESKQS